MSAPANAFFEKPILNSPYAYAQQFGKVKLAGAEALAPIFAEAIADHSCARSLADHERRASIGILG